MWIFRLNNNKYEIGYLILGFYFKDILSAENYDAAIQITSCLNGGNPVKIKNNKPNNNS